MAHTVVKSSLRTSQTSSLMVRVGVLGGVFSLLFSGQASWVMDKRTARDKIWDRCLLSSACPTDMPLRVSLVPVCSCSGPPLALWVWILRPLHAYNTLCNNNVYIGQAIGVISRITGGFRGACRRRATPQGGSQGGPAGGVAEPSRRNDARREITPIHDHV